MQTNRYTPYEMIGKYVRFYLPKRLGNTTVAGVVDDVYRDVIDHNIEVVVKNQKYVFREPASILHLTNESIVIFVYGDGHDITDEQFFAELHKASNDGLGADEAFKAMEKDNLRILFEIYDAPPTPARRQKRGRRKKAKVKKSVKKPSVRPKKTQGATPQRTKKNCTSGFKGATKGKSKSVGKKTNKRSGSSKNKNKKEDFFG